MNLFGTNQCTALPAKSLEQWTLWQVIIPKTFVTSGLHIHQIAAIINNCYLLKVPAALDLLIVKADMPLHSTGLWSLPTESTICISITLLLKDKTNSRPVSSYFLPHIFHECYTLSFRKTSLWFPHTGLGEKPVTWSVLIGKLLICGSTWDVANGSMGRGKNLPNQ